MNAAMIALILALVQEAPVLAAQLLNIWHKQGKVTAQEIADFIATQWPNAEDFFKVIPPAVTP